MTTGNETLVRFEQAEKHREGLRYVGQPRDTKVRITRYKNGAVVEVIEKHIKTDERVRKLKRRRKGIQNFPSKTAKTRAKLAKAKRLKRDAERLDLDGDGLPSSAGLEDGSGSGRAHELEQLFDREGA